MCKSTVVSKLKSTCFFLPFSSLGLFCCSIYTHDTSPLVVPGRQLDFLPTSINVTNGSFSVRTIDNSLGHLLCCEVTYGGRGSERREKRIRQFGFDVLWLSEWKVHFSLCSSLGRPQHFVLFSIFQPKASEIYGEDGTNKYLLICCGTYASATPIFRHQIQ